MPLIPTPEQEAIIKAASERTESLLIRAYAGCAKTSTLQMLAPVALPKGPALALAFNVKIKKELEKRLPGHFEVKTLNGLGHSAWGQCLGKRLELDDRKLGRLVSAELKSAGFDASTDEWNSIRNLVSASMRAGLVPEVFHRQGLVPDSKDSWAEIASEEFDMPSETLQALAKDVLMASIRESFKGLISFDDQIYCSALLGGVFPKYPLVLVDEAQDLSVLNHIQIKKTASDRLIVVGDEKQAIYAFRGADSSSIDKLKALRPNWIELPLATTFRCPQVIVKRQQDHAPGFVAWETNPQGSFQHWHRIKESDTWDWDKVQQIGAATSLNGSLYDYAVLCRNNAPLISLAFKLLRKQVGVQMLGRDIGKGLVVLAKKLMPQDSTPASECAQVIDQWQAHECGLARARDRESKIAGITDRAECLQAILHGSGAKDAGALRASCERLFSRDSGQVTLATGHRSKGLEWDLVLHLDPWRIPSKFAVRTGGKQLEQERNLNYVIDTRTKHTLIYANLEDFQ